MTGFLKVETYSNAPNVTVPAGGHVAYSFNINIPEGYKTIGIVGYNTGVGKIHFREVNIEPQSNTVNVIFGNASTTPFSYVGNNIMIKVLMCIF